jgi:hypothetical protein
MGGADAITNLVAPELKDLIGLPALLGLAALAWAARWVWVNTWLLRRRVPLPEALAFGYGQVQGTFWANAAERLSATDPKSWLACHLVQPNDSHPVRLWGRKPGASGALCLIPAEDVRRGHFADGAVRLELEPDHTPWVDLHVSPSDARAWVRRLRKTTIQ